LYVDDCTEAFALAALLPRGVDQRIYNVGGMEHLELGEIADICCELAGLPRPPRVPFPGELKRIDIGSYFTDSRLFEQSTGWQARTRFHDGVAATLAFYRSCPEAYLAVPSPIAASR
jgi:nucleoside-diphosphate-sugar epimerase